ncbi:MAG: hypothetical protein ACNA76_09020 [Anaerosomatales bacterium]
MTEPIERVEYEAQRLFAEHPSRLAHPNKRAVFEIACPPGCVHSGRIVYSRWPGAGLPPEVDPEAALGILEVRPGVYDYEPVADLPGAAEWYVNFADPELFFGYGGGLFAQDELQCAEHPVLGALREALLAEGRAARTAEGGRPTPVLVAGAERRCVIATDSDAARGRPAGLYGTQFASASADAVRSATTRIDPPTASNIIAIAAPAYGAGRYQSETIRKVLETACTGFRAAVAESASLAGEAPVVVHTGFWGCGAFGGNRVLMTMLQLLAAEAAGVDRLVFHTVRADGRAPVEEAQLRIRDALGHSPLGIEEAVERIAALGLEWGTSNGT